MTEPAVRSELRECGLLPHQADFAEAALPEDAAARILLADPVGTGKTASCAGYIRALVEQRPHPIRVLVVAPSALLEQWRENIQRIAGLDLPLVDAQTYRRLEANTRADENPWSAIPGGITAVDFIKRSARVTGVSQVRWDVVVLDEAHLCRVGSDRGQLLHLLWTSPFVRRMIAVSSSPHSGRADDFEPLLDKRTQIFRRAIGDIKGWDGEPLLRDPTDRILEVMRLDLSSAERKFLESVIETVRRRGVARLEWMNLLRRASSSLFAIEQTLRRSLARANRAAHGFERQESLWAETPESADPATALDGTQSREEIRALLQLFERIETDSKWVQAEKILTEHWRIARAPVLMFCGFADTAEYLGTLLDAAEYPVAVISAAVSMKERVAAMTRVRADGGVCIVTSGASEGMDLSFAQLCIHYDIPWNPLELARRLGTVERLGAQRAQIRHVFFADELLAFEWMVRRPLAIRDNLGAVEDVLSLIPEGRPG